MEEKAQREDVVVEAKIVCPKRNERHITRPGLNSKVRESLRRSHVFIVAPAGYGKTSLAIDSVSTASVPTAWLSLEEIDNTPARFWEYFLAALKKAAPDARFPLVSGEVFQNDAVTARFLDALIVSLQSCREMLAVVDDFHVICRGPIEGQFAYFVEHAPRQIHLVATSRETPTFPGYSKLRIQESIVEIGEDELRFSLRDIKNVCSRCSKSIDDQMARKVEDFTGGWPIAIKMLLLSNAHVEGFSCGLGFDRDLLGDYCAQEVLKALPEEIREFMLASSLMDAFSAPLAAAALDWSLGRVTSCVSYLVAKDFFIHGAIRGDGSVWYSYHDVLREAMRDVAVLEVPTHYEIQTRALAWCEERGLNEDALALARQTGDFDAVERIVRRQWRSLHASDELAVLGRWLGYLPSERLGDDVDLGVANVLVLSVNGDHKAANEQWSAVAPRITEELSEYADAMVVRAISLVCEGRSGEGISVAQSVASRKREMSSHLRGMFVLMFESGDGQIHDPTSAAKALRLLLESEDFRFNRVQLCYAYVRLSVIECMLGHYEQSEEYIALAEGQFPYFDPAAGVPTNFMPAFMARAEAAYQQDNPVLASEYLALLDDVGPTPFVAQVLGMRANLLFADQRYEKALDCALRANELSSVGFSMAYPPVALVERCLERGSLSNFEAPHAESIPCSTRIAFIARYLSGEEGLSIDVELYLEGIDKERDLDRLAFLVLLVLTGERDGRQIEADRALMQALELSDRCSIRRLILDEAAHLDSAAKRLLGGSFDHFMLQRIVRGASRKMEGAGTVRPTDRELQIMQLVDRGFVTDAIAGELRISRETVRRHIANVFSKFGAHSRTEALSLMRRGGYLK